ncbi:hypothetical protein HPB50_009722 [Hyalomma asiaticum]|uniref:Uncharacterized protein n=1 Tax=Hyalomma asiaticum TaxID=266040 RepID=A0ACB7TK32_HYAAI|nr:hypothetical protein HPB50_009722 [Hyalomma asiaticum]
MRLEVGCRSFTDVETIKVIVRPRGGLNVAKADIVHLAQALSMTEDQTKEDTVCPNKVQNIVVVSTPHEFTAMKDLSCGEDFHPPLSVQRALALPVQGRSRSATRTDAAAQRSSQREASARSHSRGHSQPDKHTKWVDKAKNQPTPGPPERRGRSPVKSRSEHVVNPGMLALEAENKQLRRDLAELKVAFESFKERAQGDRKEHCPLWRKAKRRALDPADRQSDSTAAVMEADWKPPRLLWLAAWRIGMRTGSGATCRMIYLLETLIEIRPPPPFRHRYVDWDLFRCIREEAASDDDDFAELLARLQQAVERQQARLNRRLRALISLLNKEIEAYAKELGRQKWIEKCNETDDRMRRGSRWGLLKSLLNCKASKGAACLVTDWIIRKQLTNAWEQAAVAPPFPTGAQYSVRSPT